MLNTEKQYQWFPIETAPKNGATIILWSEEDEKTGAEESIDMWFGSFTGDYWVSGFCGVDEWGHGGWSYVLNPTHWMPLPGRPEKQQCP